MCVSTRWKRIGVGVLGALGLALWLPGCSGDGGDGWQADKGPRVVTSFAPICCFTKNVAGDDAQVRVICKSVGPHDYSIRPREDIVPLHKANLFLTNGLDLDDTFTEQLKNNASNPNLKLVQVAKVALAGKGLLIRVDRQEEDKEEHDHHHGEYDPHVWLGPEEACLMVGAIRDQLKEADPAHAANYDRRAQEYTARLRQLLTDGRKELHNSGNKIPIIANHESLAYFARAFNLELVGRLTEPGKGISPQELARLKNLCETKHVRILAVEPQYQSEPAKELQGAVKNSPPKIVTIDPLETASDEDLGNPDWYEQKMRDNITKLREALP